MFRGAALQAAMADVRMQEVKETNLDSQFVIDRVVETATAKRSNEGVLKKSNEMSLTQQKRSSKLRTRMGNQRGRI